ncbi:MAG: hypothetical protein ACRDQ7_26995 [Haloechinothrix sp.]
MAADFENWHPDDVLKTPVDDVVDRLVDWGSVRCPTLMRDQASMPEPTEVVQEFRDFGEQYSRRITRLELVVPFDGEQVIFQLRANQSTLNPPRVLSLRENELVLVVDGPSDDPAQVRAALDEQLDKIEKHLAWSRQDIERHNEQIRAAVPELVAKRRQQLLSARNLQAQIGFQIRRHPDADTYSVPISRRTLKPTRPRTGSSTAPFKREPAMSEQDYRAALEVLHNSRNALERSPSLVSKLKEEEIRDILLINLNAHFKGDAAGEVFNGAGKTDILIRVEDRNKAVKKIEDHPNFKRRAPQRDDDRPEFTMQAQDDPAREIHLALVPFALRTPDADATTATNE